MSVLKKLKMFPNFPWDFILLMIFIGFILTVSSTAIRFSIMVFQKEPAVESIFLLATTIIGAVYLLIANLAWWFYRVNLFDLKKKELKQ